MLFTLVFVGFMTTILYAVIKCYANQDLSSHLYRVLDVVGVSEEVREGYRESATVDEILDAVVDKVIEDGVLSSYIFGSKYEGTTTCGLHSDTDLVFCNERFPVVENIDDAPLDGLALLMLSDDTKPGYVKLQPVVNRSKQTINEREVTHGEEADHQGRILVKHVHSTLPNKERNGPADTVPPDEICLRETDFVRAFRCRTIPSFADEWLRRPRPYQWPSEEHVQKIGSYGCFFVGVSHPESQNKETEWRISFSLQERELMSCLNPTQHKCYVLLKMIKKDIIQPKVGKSLSSYHCKTCIFHLAESRGVKHWTPKNLVFCLLNCLRLLLDWVRQENCPNYFIKEENIFDKLDKSTMTKMSHVLQDLLSNGVHFLYDIKCDDFGMLLTLNESDKRLEQKKMETKQYCRYCVYMNMATNLLGFKLEICLFINKASTPQERVSRVNHILQYLEQTTIITEHKPRDVRMSLERSITYILFLLEQMKCSNTLVQMENKTDDKVIQTLAREIQLCKRYDLISSRLIVASLFLQCGKFDNCMEILQKCETSLKPYVTSTCGCEDYVQSIDIELQEKIIDENISFEEFSRECTAACMTFLPSEANLVPVALRYEMYRSVYTPPGSREDHSDFWFDWIVVDSTVYMYYLQYIIYDKTNKPAYKNDVIDNLLEIIDNKYENLGHRETALNLLGWIFMRENRSRNAFYCFRYSLAFQPLHNAAKWHMMILLHSLIAPQTVY